jgi:cell division protein FtsZ
MEEMNQENSLSVSIYRRISSSVIKVIGVGGGGSNAVNYMYEQGIRGVDFVVCNTDAQALNNSPVPLKVQLGVYPNRRTRSRCKSGSWERAPPWKVSMKYEGILEKNTKMIFVTAGMGGGTGTGAAPVVARVAKEMGILTVGIVTIPFSFEGKYADVIRQKKESKHFEKMSIR